MRLLSTNTYQFQEFFDTAIPKYAILSHRWGNGELTLQDLESGQDNDSKNYAKIHSCCNLARNRGFHWVWIDTCCIDKKSSAELSEAINSMYRWYQNAGECYAYLNDVLWGCPTTDAEIQEARTELRDSKWFLRGWTLQELLAPKRVLFYDRDWSYIGSKSGNREDASELAPEIAQITGIDVEYVRHEHLMTTACAAVKMSWLSRRVTSRTEDMAYCMLGLFNVNMPLLYGEGKAAFLRLQHEIIKQSDDESIFAWITGPVIGRTKKLGNGLFAPDPSYFASSGTIRSLDTKRPPWVMTNRGLQIHAPNSDISADSGTLLRLYCWNDRARDSTDDPTGKAVLLTLAREKPGSDSYIRVRCNRWRQRDVVSAPTVEQMKYTTCIYVRGIYA